MSVYIGYIRKSEYNKIKKMSKSELYAFKGEDMKDGYVGTADFVTKLYDFGKCVDFVNNNELIPFFKDKELQKDYDEDCELYIVNRDFFEKAIDNYRTKIRKYYTDMVTPILRNECEFMKSAKLHYDDDMNEFHTIDLSDISEIQQNALYNMISHIRDFSMEWTHLTPYDLNDGPEVTKSWKYEYAIFELIRIYKSFNWNKNLLVYFSS